MSEQVSKAQKAFHSAKNDFFKLAAKTNKEITRERDVLRRKLKQANVRLRKTRTKLVTAEKKFQKSSTAAAKVQVEKMGKLLDETKVETAHLREKLHSVSERMKNSKEYAATAKFFQLGIDNLDKEWNKLIEKKENDAAKISTVKKTTKKKVVKKVTVKKKVAKKTAVKKKTTTKKKVAKKSA